MLHERRLNVDTGQLHHHVRDEVVDKQVERHVGAREVLHRLLLLGLRRERVEVDVVLSGVNEPHGVDLEDQAHDQRERRRVAVEVDAVVVHLDLTVRQGVKPEVLGHVPHGHAHEHVLEVLTLVEPQGRPVLVVLVGELHRHEHLSGEAGRVDGALVIEDATAHHKGAHERDDAEKLHEVLAAVEPGDVVRVLGGDEPVVIKVLRRPEERLEKERDAEARSARSARELEEELGVVRRLG
mmetsp:Transcript_616/g.1211  ORF Transcript_616/g.1211 Transcript_616/m.1211 type:complete len:239 (+) Transcript_616:98-814(+)